MVLNDILIVVRVILPFAGLCLFYLGKETKRVGDDIVIMLQYEFNIYQNFT
jgi:hypothetical protein